MGGIINGFKKTRINKKRVFEYSLSGGRIIIKPDYFFIFLILFVLLLIFDIPLKAQELDKQDSLSSLKDSTENIKTLQSKDKLFELKKELLLFELKYRQIGNNLAFENQWQLRLLFLLLTGSFLTLCFSSNTFRTLNISNKTKWISTILVFSIFYIYDAQQGSLYDRSMIRGNNTAALLNNLEDNSYLRLKEIEPFPLSGSQGFVDRWLSRFGQILKMEYFLFYVFTLVFWIGGWYFKEKEKE